MKSIRFIFIFIIALFFLLGLQSIWLYNTYQLEKEKTIQIINTTFVEAAKLELTERLDYAENFYRSQGIDSISFQPEYFTMDSVFLSEQVVPMDFIMLQHLVDREMELPLNLSSLDSIYERLLLDKNIRTNYNIHYLDSLNLIANQTDPAIRKGHQTYIIPIANHHKVQAIVELYTPTIFRNMIGILLTSAFIVCLIIACLVYATRTIITQQQLSKLRDNFVYALTHDMKTPLGTIHTVLDQSAKGLLDAHPDMKSKFNRIAIEQTLNLQALVNQILTVAYIEQRKLSLHKQPVDLSRIIQELTDKFSVKQEKEILFSVRYELKDDTLYADPFYLSNAISNLLDNAIKYSGNKVAIDIFIEGKGNQVYIHIRDNGFGIPEKDQKKIFNRFERGNEINRKSTSGFGIGLNYVKLVIEAHNGGISVNSKEGSGSEFVITLPLNQE